MKVKLFWMLAVCAAILTGCGDDDEKKKSSNVYEFDGSKKTIRTAYYYSEDLEDGNYALVFSSDDEETDRIAIELSGSHDGQTVSLSEVDDEFDWHWWLNIQKFNADSEALETIITGSGSNENSFEDVAEGTLFIQLVNEAEKIFEVKLNIVTTDDKKFKFYYKGKMTPDDGGLERKKASNN